MSRLRSGRLILGLALAAAVEVAAAESGAAASTRSTYATRVQPIWDAACVSCHGAEKAKAGLRLDSHAAILRGAKDEAVLQARSPDASELYRRIALPSDHEDVMPPDGKKLLTPAQIAVVRAWILAGAPATATFEHPDAPEFHAVARPRPVAPDYRPFLAKMSALEQEWPIRLVPVSQNPHDGIILRTASAPQRVDDALIARLAPLAALIVDAELARTQITDTAMKTLAGFTNLRHLDLSRTQVTSAGIAELGTLSRLETLNLVGSHVDARAQPIVEALPALRAVYAFGTAMMPATPAQP